jgi:hypothetical protein
VGTAVSIWTDVRRMRAEHPSGWLVAWSRVKTMHSARVQRYLALDADERRRDHRWLYRE